MRQIQIGTNEAGQRLDKLLNKYLSEAPKSFLYKMMRKKNITLNGKKAVGNELLVKGDEVTLFLSDETVSKFSGSSSNQTNKNSEEDKTLMKPTDIQNLAEQLQVLYEDDHILLLNKPVGMLSQKAASTDISLVEYLTAYLLYNHKLTVEEMRTFKPAICNRLDRNTSGIVAAGKSLVGLQELSRFFKERTLEKRYYCLVKGEVLAASYLKGYLVKDTQTNHVRITEHMTADGSPIETEFIPVKSTKEITLLEVHLITGKTHQIRAHLATTGHPIIGDYKYGSKKINDSYQQRYGLKHQLLHAYRLAFPEIHGPLSNLSGREFIAPIPQKFERIAKDKGVL